MRDRETKLRRRDMYLRMLCACAHIHRYNFLFVAFKLEDTED